jgi:hypothetical protein
MDESSATYETKEQSQESDADFVRFWLDAIEAASREEKEFRDDGEDVIQIYRGEKDSETEFNIVYSNVETLLPAIYNSTPVPDVRRRFGDRDAIGKTIADMLERGLSYSLDSYDFDATMRNVIFDSALPGRGLARVRYIPYMDETGEAVAYEEASCEYVPWKHFRHGAARVWDEVPWIAFEHFLNRDQLRQLNEELADEVQLDCSTRGEAAQEDKSDIFKRARVWEIWDKDAKEVIFIATGYTDKALSRQPDPLGLTGFYPMPRPIQPINTPGKLCPVTPYRAYKKLAEELNSVTQRIQKLVKQIKVKGGYPSGGQDVSALANADDGEIVALQGLEAFVSSSGDVNKMIAWWPIEPQVKALAQLYQQRELIKQTIYEVTGLSDIVRGASMASETATAQQIKAQWGSLRIQRLQAEVQRFARDLFRLKAEIFATKFDIRNLSLITGIAVLPQQQIAMAQQQAAALQQQQQPIPPQLQEALKAAPLEQVEQIMRSDLMRSYKIDVESDSTIRADLTRNQEQMAGFIQGTAQYMQAALALAQGGMAREPLVEIYSAFARQFKLGKQAEDALDRMAEMAKQPQEPKPDPEAEKLKLEQQRMQMQAQADQQKQQADMQMEQVRLQMEQQKAQQQMQLEQYKAEQSLALEQYKAQVQAGLAMQKQEQDAQIKLADHEMKREGMAADFELKREGQQIEGELERERMAGEQGVPALKGNKQASAGPIGGAVAKMGESLGKMIAEQNAASDARHADMMQMFGEMMRQQSAPKRVVRDRAGNVVGVEPAVTVN